MHVPGIPRTKDDGCAGDSNKFHQNLDIDALSLDGTRLESFMHKIRSLHGIRCVEFVWASPSCIQFSSAKTTEGGEPHFKIDKMDSPEVPLAPMSPH